MSDIKMYDWMIAKRNLGWNVYAGDKVLVVDKMSANKYAVYSERATGAYMTNRLHEKIAKYAAARADCLERIDANG